MKFIIELIQKLLGFGSSDTTKASLEKLQQLKQANADSLEALKDQIRDLVARIGLKKRELDDAKIPALRSTVEREIGELLNEVDRLKTREDFIVRNTTRTSKLVEKYLQNQIAKDQGVTEEMLVDLTVETEEVLAGMVDEDFAMEQLESRKYRPIEQPEAEEYEEAEASLEERLREIGFSVPEEAPSKKPDLDLEE